MGCQGTLQCKSLSVSIRSFNAPTTVFVSVTERSASRASVIQATSPPTVKPTFNAATSKSPGSCCSSFPSSSPSPVPPTSFSARPDWESAFWCCVAAGFVVRRRVEVRPEKRTVTNWQASSPVSAASPFPLLWSGTLLYGSCLPPKPKPSPTRMAFPSLRGSVLRSSKNIFRFHTVCKHHACPCRRPRLPFNKS